MRTASTCRGTAVEENRRWRLRSGVLLCVAKNASVLFTPKKAIHG